MERKGNLTFLTLDISEFSLYSNRYSFTSQAVFKKKER